MPQLQAPKNDIELQSCTPRPRQRPFRLKSWSLAWFLGEARPMKAFKGTTELQHRSVTPSSPTLHNAIAHYNTANAISDDTMWNASSRTEYGKVMHK
eukprot:651940-Amphidinium_carterae.1